MNKDIEGGGNQVPTKSEILEHAVIDSVAAKKVFPIDLPPTSQTNPSLTVTEVIVGDVTTTTIEKVIGSTTYTKTVIENSSTGVTTVSVWS